MRYRLCRMLVMTTAAASLPAAAQTRYADSTNAKSTSSSHRRTSPLLFAVIGGPGVETPTPYFFVSEGNLYQTQKRPMVFEVEVSRSLWASGGTKTFLEYFVALQPAVSVGGNVNYLFQPCHRLRCFNSGIDVVEQRYTAYGIGLTPFGARMTTTLPLRAKFSLALAAGGVALNRPVPYEKAKQFNFQLSARPAVGLPIRNSGTLWAGCEFFHMSNANTSPINPGINAGLIMFGFQRGG
jgi:hypothetical protein